MNILDVFMSSKFAIIHAAYLMAYDKKKMKENRALDT